MVSLYVRAGTVGKQSLAVLGISESTGFEVVRSDSKAGALYPRLLLYFSAGVK